MAPLTGVNVVPPSVETSHCTVGVGEPVAAAVKVAVAPEATDTFEGLAVTTGGVVTVRVAAVVVAPPAELVKTASYWSPLSAGGGGERVGGGRGTADGAKVVPPSVETSHCTVGVGEPVRRGGEGGRASGDDGRVGGVGGDYWEGW